MFVRRWLAPIALTLGGVLLGTAIAAPAKADNADKDKAKDRINILDLQDEVFKQAQWRSIGPAVMGGRIADIAVDPKSPYTYYLALATGGVLKTTNDGTAWTPLFTHEAVASIGTIAISPTDSNTIWVGTGEANGRNSSSWGNGVYKSTDGGSSWTCMGLKETQEIGRIVIDPKNPNTIYVAAAGALWGPNKERGIYQTTDGGKTWSQSLTLGPDIGAIDVTLGAPGSGIVFAAAYGRRRSAWGFQEFSPAAGVYKSSDNGKTWAKLTNGLPTGSLGRIGLSVSASKPNIVYAVIEDNAGGSNSLFDIHSQQGGVFRSDDSGQTWKRMSGTAPRGFYFSQIRVDPTDPDRVYVLGFNLSMSSDGGKTFSDNASPGVHSDLHALWIDPAHPEHLLLGTDGGLYVSHDQAKTWDFQNNYPMGEFYEVTVDMQQPYWVYGGLQDNGGWAGPSALQAYRGPSNSNWLSLTGGDGFYALADPTDSNIVYSESQNGGAERQNHKTHARRSLNPTAPEGTPDYRFNWNTPLCLSPFDHDVLYMGGSHLFKFTNEGKDWEAISPDLSKQDGTKITSGGSGAETYGTIVTISPSPLSAGQIWVGTDDGNVQVTQNEGKTWTNVTGNLPEEVHPFWVTRIEASHFNPQRAYVAVDGHRSEVFAPFLYRTDDNGQSWKSVAGDLPTSGPIQALREDPVNADVLFVGTEFGAYVTLDGGKHWRKLDNGLPTVAVDDLAIQPRDHALVAATHGRSLFVLDNIAPIEDLTPAIETSDLHLFPVAPVKEFIPDFSSSAFAGGHDFIADNSPSGMQITYWMKSLADAGPQIKITDAKGKTVANLSGDRLPGLETVNWDLRGPADDQNSDEGGFPFGGRNRFVTPGLYTVTLTLGKATQSQKVMITGGPELSDRDAADTEAALEKDNQVDPDQEVGTGGDKDQDTDKH